MCNWFKKKWRAWRYKRTMAKLRNHLDWFGLPTNQLSDVDIEIGIKKLSDIFRVFGVSSAEIIKSFGRLYALGAAIRKKQRESER